MASKNNGTRIKIKKLLSKTFLQKEYVNKKKSTIIIAKENDITKTTVLKYLKKHAIKRRTQTGKNHYKYVNGNSYKKHKCCCGKIISVKSKRCFSCYVKGELLLRIRELIKPKNRYYCEDCGKEVSKKKYKRCGSCAQIINSPIVQNRPELKEKHRLSMLKFMQDIDWKNDTLKKSFAGRLLKPNKPEKQMVEILPKSFRYVGDGYTFIAGKNPDFINFQRKLIVELFGDYWHKKSEIKPRINHFKKYGYRTLIIWEHELIDINKVKDKITAFINFDEKICYT